MPRQEISTPALCTKSTGNDNNTTCNDKLSVRSCVQSLEIPMLALCTIRQEIPTPALRAKAGDPFASFACQYRRSLRQLCVPRQEIPAPALRTKAEDPNASFAYQGRRSICQLCALRQEIPAPALRAKAGDPCASFAYQA